MPFSQMVNVPSFCGSQNFMIPHGLARLQTAVYGGESQVSSPGSAKAMRVMVCDIARRNREWTTSISNCSANSIQFNHSQCVSISANDLTGERMWNLAQ